MYYTVIYQNGDVGRLRGYGNAINAQQAQAFIEAFLPAIWDSKFGAGK